MRMLPPEIAFAEDLERFDRLMVRSFGQFRCVVFRVRTEEQVDVLSWLPERIRELEGEAWYSAGVVPIDVGHLGENILHGLREKSAFIRRGAVLIFFGFEEAQRRAPSRRAGPLQQLNVQRDPLVREFPYPWILLMEPETDRLMGKIAPDFADFVALRVGPDRVEIPDEPTTRSERPELALEQALRSMFSADELRRLVHMIGGREIADDLPSPIVSPAMLIHEVVGLVMRRGLLEELLDAMLQARPRRAAAIKRLRQQLRRGAGLSERHPVVAAIEDLPLSGREELYAHIGPLLGRRFSLRDTAPQALYDAAAERPAVLATLVRVLTNIGRERYA